jgi:1,4-dihydroxy-2-naphthoyl-CoA synthase
VQLLQMRSSLCSSCTPDLEAMPVQELGGNATMLFYQSEEGNEARAFLMPLV